MGKGSLIGAFLMMSVLVLSLILLYEYSWNASASTDLGVNLSGTTYQQAHNYSGNTTRVALSMYSYVPMLGGIIGLIFALMVLMAVVSKYNR